MPIRVHSRVSRSPVDEQVETPAVGQYRLIKKLLTDVQFTYLFDTFHTFVAITNGNCHINKDCFLAEL